MDLVGPLPLSRGYQYLFTVIDRTTRWPEAIPLTTITDADCAQVLFTGWIARFGVPSVITTYREAQFTSSLWASLCQLLNINHSTTTAYHPQSKGLVERFHLRLKDDLHARTAIDVQFRLSPCASRPTNSTFSCPTRATRPPVRLNL